MKKIRLLVIDDSVVVRRMISDVVAPVPELEVVGTAANGRIGLAKMQQLCPDIVTLDLEMPDMNGLETVVEIRKLYPFIPIIMFSSQTEQGAAITLEAMSLGVTDYVAKPSNTSGMADAVERIRAELIPKILSLFGAGAKSSVLPPPKLQTKTLYPMRVEAIAIGCSTGGPNALPVVLKELSAALPVPVFVVQHMPPVFTKQLAMNLRKTTGLDVNEASDGVMVEAGQVWIAPGNFHMTVHRKAIGVQLQLNQDPQENGCRPAVDPLFRSVAEAYKSNSLGVVLTGMGKDGTAGAKAIHAANGRVIVQDEATSVVWGMPGSIVRAGIADAVHPLDRIGSELLTRLRTGRVFSMKTEVTV